MITNTEFAARARDIADNYKTLYVLGGFGDPLTVTKKEAFIAKNAFNRRADRAKKIRAATRDTFAMDCSGTLKAILWGWNGNLNHGHGGAKYASNDVPDQNADTFISRCRDVSTDFSRIQVGEAVWIKGHIGIYVGDGLAVETTYRWKDGTQYTACNCDVAGYHRRDWTKHGKLPYVKYPKDIRVGDLVRITGTHWYGGKTIPTWVLERRWYVSSIRGNRVVLDRSEDGKSRICSPIHIDIIELAD